MFRLLTLWILVFASILCAADTKPKAPSKPAAKPKAAPKAPDLGGVREEHVMISMRDGAKLSTYLFFPPIQGKLPAIYQQRYVDISSAGQKTECAKLAKLIGCVVALQNFRGAHESEGVFQGYRALGLGELKDGYDSVEWLAAQSWCTGKVGSWGGSQGGYSQNFLAASQPPHLVAQYLTDFGVSLFHDGYRGGGVVRPTRFLGKMAIHARDIEEGKAALLEQFKHPTYDSWWAQENTEPHFGKMNYPSVMLGGWFDPVHKAVIRAWQGREKYFPGKQLLILGPWNHGGSFRVSNKVGDLEFPSVAVFDPRAHMAQWFGEHLLGRQNHVMVGPHVRYYVMGACGEKDAPGHQWRTASTFPPTGNDTPFHLAEGGQLTAYASSGSTTWTSDPNHPNQISGASYPAALDQRKFESHPDCVAFTTAPLDKPQEWTGLVKARIFVSSTAHDTDLIVRLCDVYPDGRSILLIDNIRRLRFRNGFEKEEPLEPGKIHQVSLDLGYTSIVFNKGHRIRVTIASTGDDWYEPNPQTGKPLTIEFPKEVVVAKNTIHHDAAHPSAIIAPIPAH